MRRSSVQREGERGHARSAASSAGRCSFVRPPTGTRERFPASPEHGRVRVGHHVATGSHVTLRLAPTLRSPAGRRRPAAAELHDRGRAGVLRQWLRVPRRVRSGWHATSIRMTHRSAKSPTSPPRSARSISLTANQCRSQGGHCQSAPRDYDGPDYGEGLGLEDAGFDAAAARTAATRSRRARDVEVSRRPDAWLHLARHRSTTGTAARSPASAKGRASGRRTAARRCRSTRATCPTSRSGPLAVGRRRADAHAPRAAAQEDGFRSRARDAGADRRLAATPDRIQSHGLDVSKTLKPGGTGLVWAAVREEEPIPRARRYNRDGERSGQVIDRPGHQSRASRSRTVRRTR